MKSHAKAKRRTHHAGRAAASAHRSHKSAPARRHAAAKSKTETAPEDAGISRLEQPSLGETFAPGEAGRSARDESRGPLGPEGESESENDRLASLEEAEPDEGADI